MGLVLGPSEHHQSHFTDEDVEPQHHLDTLAIEFPFTQKQAFKESLLRAKLSGC